MGLDITAYRKLTKLDVVFDADGESIDPVTRDEVGYDFFAYVNPDFPGREEGVEHRACYRAEQRSGFRAGSYSGYNAWREMLAKMAGYPALPVDRYGTGNIDFRHDAGAHAAGSGPFFEMIWFTDCEGVIGPVVSRKLAEDFRQWDEKAQQFSAAIDGWSGHFYRLYLEWKIAFEMAADDGAVSFH